MAQNDQTSISTTVGGQDIAGTGINAGVTYTDTTTQSTAVLGGIDTTTLILIGAVLIAIVVAIKILK